MPVITTRQLAEATAGGDCYIRTKNNEVKGLAIKFDINRHVPRVVIFGHGPIMSARAELFLESGAAIPMYLKQGVNAWEYIGNYRATAIRRDDASIQKYASDRPPGSVKGILFLEEVVNSGLLSTSP